MPVSGIIAAKEDAVSFCGSCVALRSLWEHYRTLFEGSDLKRELLQTTGPVTGLPRPIAATPWGEALLFECHG